MSIGYCANEDTADATILDNVNVEADELKPYHLMKGKAIITYLTIKE